MQKYLNKIKMKIILYFLLQIYQFYKGETDFRGAAEKAQYKDFKYRYIWISRMKNCISIIVERF